LGQHAGLTEQYGLPTILTQPIGQRGAEEPPLPFDPAAWQGLLGNQTHDSVRGYSQKSGSLLQCQHGIGFNGSAHIPSLQEVLLPYSRSLAKSASADRSPFSSVMWA